MMLLRKTDFGTRDKKGIIQNTRRDTEEF